MGAQNIPTHIKKTIIIKELVCKKNHRLLREYGITKGQVVQFENEKILLVKYHDESTKQDRFIKLSRKLMKNFKEVK